MFCVTLMAVLQVMVITPDAYAVTGGDELIIRVQYIGERGDKVREVTRFTRNEMSSMSDGLFYYSNSTSVGGIMRTKATGPKVTTILNHAGIDIGSIHHINFRNISDARPCHRSS